MSSRAYIHLLLLLAAHSVAAYNFQFIANATRTLHSMFHFETFIIIRNASATRTFVGGMSLEESLQRLFATPMICLKSDVSTSMRLRSTVNTNSMGFAVMDNLADPIRNLSDVVLRKLHSVKLAFILIDPLADVSERSLIAFFRWCWKANFLDIILTYSTDSGMNEVLTYTPFPEPIRILNLTSASPSRYFWNKVANVMGYKFATPVFVDEPLVIKVFDEKTGQLNIKGSAGRLYKEFLRQINGQFFVVNLSNDSLHLHQKRVVEMATNKVIDIGIHPFTYLLPYPIDGSYPIAHTNACLILPVVPEIDRSYYVVYAFSHQMWLIMVGLVVAFLAVKIIADYTRDHTQARNPRPAITLPKPSRWRTRALMHVLLMFTWFFVSNLYVSALASLLSTTVNGKQPETADDILQTGLEILLLEYEATAFFRSKLFPSELKKRARITDPDTQASFRNQLDTSFAYIVKEERWLMIDYQQSRLWKPVFKIVQNFCVPNMFLSFPIQFDSPFYEVLKAFTLRADSTGLYKQWSALSFQEAKEAGVIRLANETRQHPVPLKMEHFKLIFKLVAGAFCVSFGFFFGEIYAARVPQQSCNKK